MNKTIKLKASNTKFELDEQRTVAKVVENGKVKAEIIICSDGLIIKQKKTTIINWV